MAANSGWSFAKNGQNEPDSRTCGDSEEKPLDLIREQLYRQTAVISTSMAKSLKILETNSQSFLINISKEIKDIENKRKNVISLEEALKMEHEWLKTSINALEKNRQHLDKCNTTLDNDCNK